MSLKHRGLAIIAAVAMPAVLAAQQPVSQRAQQNRAPDRNAAQIMIAPFRTAGFEQPAAAVGREVAEDFRRRVARAFPSDEVHVLPEERTKAWESPFDSPELLQSPDIRTLAIVSRADAYVTGSIVQVGNKFRAEADLRLSRENAARQPLGVGESSRMGDALDALVKELKNALKQMDGEKKCAIAAREGRYPPAIEFANAAIVAYPKATFARVCLLHVLEVSRSPAAEIVKVARELVTLDPRSNFGLAFLADAYRRENQRDSLIVVLGRMVRNDPRDLEHTHPAMREISAANPALARSIIDSVIARNPADVELRKIRWSILYAARDYKEMRAEGEQLLRLDTAFADTTYFTRTALSFAADSQWPQAAAIATQGVAKFPANGSLVGLEIQFLQRARQFVAASEKIRKAFERRIDVPQFGPLRPGYRPSDQQPPTEIIAAARKAITEGDTTGLMRLIILSQANAMFAAAQALTATAPAKAETDLVTGVLGTLAYLDSIGPAIERMYFARLRAETNLHLGVVIKLPAAERARSCPLARAAIAYLVEAIVNGPPEFSFAPESERRKWNAVFVAHLQAEALMRSIPNCK